MTLVVTGLESDRCPTTFAYQLENNDDTHGDYKGVCQCLVTIDMIYDEMLGSVLIPTYIFLLILRILFAVSNDL